MNRISTVDRSFSLSFGQSYLILKSSSIYWGTIFKIVEIQTVEKKYLWNMLPKFQEKKHKSSWCPACPWMVPALLIHPFIIAPAPVIISWTYNKANTQIYKLNTPIHNCTWLWPNHNFKKIQQGKHTNT